MEIERGDREREMNGLDEEIINMNGVNEEIISCIFLF